MRKNENFLRIKDGKTEAHFVRGSNINGKAHHGHYTEKPRAESGTKAAVHSVKVREQAQKDRKQRTLAEYAREWLESEREGLKEASYVKYEDILSKHIIPLLGKARPDRLNDEAAEQFTQQLSERGLAPKTVRDILTVLRSVLKYAAGQGDAVPAIIFKTPKEPRRDMRILSVDEQRRLTLCLTNKLDDCKFGILLALLTGMRIGEICALRWGGISISEGTVCVTETMQRLRNLDGGAQRTQVVIGTPKSESSRRVIPMTDFTAEICRRMGKHEPGQFVLTGSEHYMEPRALQYRLEKYTAECGLEGVHFHTLRHTFATRCVEVGVELKALSEILGHSTTAVTLERYIHPTLEMKRRDIKKLSAVGL